MTIFSLLERSARGAIPQDRNTQQCRMPESLSAVGAAPAGVRFNQPLLEMFFERAPTQKPLLQQNCHLDRSVAEWRDLQFSVRFKEMFLVRAYLRLQGARARRLTRPRNPHQMTLPVSESTRAAVNDPGTCDTLVT
jgi:hypothetical protein